MTILKLSSKEREMQKHLYLEVQSRSQDEHNQHTPLELGEEIVEKLIESNADFSGNILIVSTVEFIPVILRVLTDRGLSRDKVWFSSWNEYKRNFIKKLGINTIGHLLDQEIEMKFDVIIGNPPYKRGLHLKILEKSLDLLSDTGSLCFIHPAEWLCQLRTNGKGKYYAELRQKISNIASSIQFKDGTLEMDIGAYMPLSITFLNKNKTANSITFIKNNNIETVQHLDEINSWANTKKIKNILDKIDISNNFKNNLKKNYLKYFVNFNAITGNGHLEIEYYDNIKRKTKNMFNLVNSTCNFVSEYPLYSKSQSKNKEAGNEKLWISFNSLVEAQNCLDYLTKSKLLKFLIVIYKIDQHADSILDFLPFLDFSKEWTDENLYKHYKLTSEDIALIDEVIDKITIK